MNARTADSNVVRRDIVSGSGSVNIADLRVGLDMLRQSSHLTLVQAALAKQIEYSNGFTFHHCLLPVMKAWCWNAVSYVTETTPPKSWLALYMKMRYASTDMNRG